MAQKIVHFEIIGQDGKKLQDFYSKLLDWNVDASNPMNYGLVSADQAGVGGGIAAGQDPSQRYITIYAAVDDLAATLKKAESLGGKTIMEPMDVPGGPTIAMFTDPEGNVFGLLKAGTM